jgi:phosphate acetyltransferase
MNILKDIREKAKKDPRKIVFPESSDERILKACEIVLKQKIARPILLGNPKEVLEKAKKIGVNIKGFEIVDPLKSEKLEDYAKTLYEIRKKKGVSIEEAGRLLKDDLHFGAIMLQKNDADGMIGGASYSTANTIRCAFRIIGTKKGIGKASGAMIMIKDNMMFLFADCAVIPNPDSDDLAEIAELSIKTYESIFNKKAKAGMLSYSTTGSGKGESVEKVRKAVKIASRKGLNVVGEIQADAALIDDVCERKCPQIKCREKINAFVFPSLDSGNISYKLVERLGGFRAVGPILQGLKKPMNDLSRGCSVEDIVDLAAITVVQAQKQKGD